ncbi:MAG: ABC transporter ATP-binding protein [Firmicutes bacterium]|mgnify:CR=1 FL=1|nr:ABC transporter ATP-binding protein [Bacillota bacterium]
MAIKICNLNFTYSNGYQALIDINLNIKKGKKTAILGLNGSGKTTLLYHLNGMHLPQTGSVEVFNLPVKQENLAHIRRKVGFLFDYPDHQIFSTTVYNDIKFGLDNYRFPEDEKEPRIRNIAKALQIESLLSFPPYQLSLGQKKKVAIAGLLVLEPSMIVCDEPFSGLDGPSLVYFKSLLDDWVKADKTIVFSTHDVDLTYEWAEEVVVLHAGKIIEAGPVEEVLTKEEVYVRAGLTKPLLYELFSHFNCKPRNITQAKELLAKFSLEYKG